MAIAFDNSTLSGGTTGTTKTYSHTVNSNTNGILFVSTHCTLGITDDITGVTYAGASMTLVDRQNHANANVANTALWYLLTPASGANNVVISTSLSVTILSCAASYTGAKQSGVPDASNKSDHSSGGITSYALAVTTVADKCWQVMAMVDSTNTPAAGTGTTRRQGSASGFGFFDNNAAITPAGSNTLTSTFTSSTDVCGVSCSFAPFVAAPAGPAFLLNMV